MSAYKTYTPIDFSKGVYYNVERDDFDNYRSWRHWMTIEGEEVDLTENQYNVLMRQREEFHRVATQAERERILQGIQKLEDQSHATRTPIYQETMFAKIREIINGQVG